MAIIFRKDYPVESPCVICGGVITRTVERSGVLRPVWAIANKCENWCDLNLVSPLLGKKWESQSHSGKAALEKYLKSEKALIDEIDEARRKCEFCGKIPQVKILDDDEKIRDYYFQCECPQLNSVTVCPYIHGAALYRCVLIRRQREIVRAEARKQRKLAPHRFAVEQFNQRSEELS